MKVRVLSGGDVRRLLPMERCIDLMADALRTLARGEAVQPLRTAVRVPRGTGLVGLMPGFLAAPRALGLKAVTVFPDNHGTPLDSHQGVVLLFDPDDGRPLAMLDASSITEIRTAAASGAATRALAREEASTLAILGSGVQARSHLAAMRAARRLASVKVWSRSFESARRFAEREADGAGVPIAAVREAQDAVLGADLVCTTTASSEPVLRGAWLSPGAHVNAVGACFPRAREIDTEAARRSRIFVDRRESALAEAGDILIPISEGALTADAIVGEIGDVLMRSLAGRRSEEEITLFKSLGLAVEDLATARFLLDEAERLGAGVLVDLAGG